MEQVLQLLAGALLPILIQNLYSYWIKFLAVNSEEIPVDLFIPQLTMEFYFQLFFIPALEDQVSSFDIQIHFQNILELIVRAPFFFHLEEFYLQLEVLKEL